LAKNANPIIVNAIGVTSVSIAQDVVSGAAINAGDNTPVVVGAGARTAFGEILAQLKAVINPLHYAVVNDDDGKVEQLLDARADPNLIDRFGNAPLHYAHTPKIIELLCKCGAEPNKQDKEGNTPLHNAVFAEELDLERIGALLKCNAKTNIVNREGFTPLSFVGKVISYGRIRWLYDFEELDAEKRSVFIQAKQLLERYSRR
jgi:hypothetical protein